MFQFTEITRCRNSTADLVSLATHPTHINSGQVLKSLNGDLQILMEVSTGLLLLKLGEFEYGVGADNHVLYDDGGKDCKLVLCLRDGVGNQAWLLKVNDNSDLMQNIVGERCRLMHWRGVTQGSKSEMVEYPVLREHQPIAKHQPGSGKSQPGNGKKKEEASSEYGLVEASKTVAKGLTMAGTWLSKGLEYIGEYFSKKVDPTQPINLSPQTKALIENSVSASARLLEYSTQKIAGIFRLAVGDAKLLQFRISDEPRGNIDYAKQNLRAGLEAVTNVYDGYMQGYDQAAKGLSKGTNHIISARYGRQAGDAALKIGQGVRNVNKLPKVGNDALKKVLVETAKNQFRPEQPIQNK